MKENVFGNSDRPNGHTPVEIIKLNKNCAKRHIRPLYVNFRGDIFLFLVWFRVWHSSVQPLFISFNSCCSICPPWRMMWPYCIVEVDNFWSGLFPSVAQLSSDFHYFSCFPVLQQILSLTWIVSTIFCLRGRWYFWPIRGLENVTWQKDRRTDGQKEILTLWRPMPSGQRP